jgi:hypothetical protein
MFKRRITVYGEARRDHIGDHDLIDVIEAPTTQDHWQELKHIYIRNTVNEDLYPFDFALFVDWWNQHKTHPMTREDLSYLEPMIAFKKKVMQILPEQFEVTVDQTQACLEQWVSQKMNPPHHQLPVSYQSFPETTVAATAKDQTWSSNPVLQWLWVDVNHFHTQRLIFDQVNYDVTQNLLITRPVGTFLLRTSSQHNNVMRNANIVVFATHISPGKILQVRLLHLWGVGWYSMGNHIPPKSSDIIAAYGKPIAVRWLELLELLMVQYNTTWSNLLTPDMLSSYTVLNTSDD